MFIPVFDLIEECMFVVILFVPNLRNMASAFSTQNASVIWHLCKHFVQLQNHRDILCEK